jgi:cytochrome c-type biogenesis protein CcmH/NrfG
MGLAITLMNSNDPKLHDEEEVIQLSSKACELTHNQEPEPLVLLAAAYADAGNFQEAIRTANMALSLANSTGKTRLAMSIQKKIELYRMDKSTSNPN